MTTLVSFSTKFTLNKAHYTECYTQSSTLVHNKKTYFKKLKTLASDLNLDDTKILFCDGRSDIENVYKISSIVFNLSSKAEPFGRTMIEAAACGSSVVGWDYGG